MALKPLIGWQVIQQEKIGSQSKVLDELYNAVDAGKKTKMQS